MPNIDPDDLKHLQGLEGTPLVYRISNDVPTVSTEFGEVQIGSMLSYQVQQKSSKFFLYFNAYVYHLNDV